MVLWRLQSTLPTQHGFWIMISHLQLPAARNCYPYCTWNCKYKLSKRSPLLKWLWWSLTKLWAGSSSFPFSQWTKLDLPAASTGWLPHERGHKNWISIVKDTRSPKKLLPAQEQGLAAGLSSAPPQWPVPEFVSKAHLHLWRGKTRSSPGQPLAEVSAGSWSGLLPNLHVYFKLKVAN